MVEGVNDYTNNQVTLHTAPGCSMPSSDPTTLGISGSLIGGTDCAAADTANAGCGVRASETNSYGAPFNAMGGGVYASKFSSYIGWHDADRGILQLQRYGTTTGSRPGSSRAARYPQTCRAVHHSPRHGARPWPHSRPRHATRSSTSISTQPSLTPPSGMYPVSTRSVFQALTFIPAVIGEEACGTHQACPGRIRAVPRVLVSRRARTSCSITAHRSLKLVSASSLNLAVRSIS